MSKTPQEKLLEQLAMLSEYADRFPPEGEAYDQDDDFSLAVSQTLTRVFVDGSKIKLGEPQCVAYLKACSKTSKAQGNPLKTILAQVATLRADPVAVVHQVVRSYMRNMMVQNLLSHASMGVQETMEFFDPTAFLMDGKRREFLRVFLRRIQDCTFDIDVVPPPRELSLRDMRSRLEELKEKQTDTVESEKAGYDKCEDEILVEQEAQQNVVEIEPVGFAIQPETAPDLAHIQADVMGDIISSFTSFQAASIQPVENLPVQEPPTVVEELAPNPEEIAAAIPITQNSAAEEVCQNQSSEPNPALEQQLETKEPCQQADDLILPERLELQHQSVVQEPLMQSYSPSTSTSQIKTGELIAGVGGRASQSQSLPRFEEYHQERLVARPQETFCDLDSPKRIELEDSGSDDQMVVVAPIMPSQKELVLPQTQSSVPQDDKEDAHPEVPALKHSFLSSLPRGAEPTRVDQEAFLPRHWITDARHYSPLEEVFRFVSPGVDTQCFVAQIMPIGAEYCSVDPRECRKIAALEARWNPRQIAGARPLQEEAISIKGVVHSLRNAASKEFGQTRIFRHLEDAFIVPEQITDISYAFSFPEVDVERQLGLQGNCCAGCRKQIGENDSFWFCSFSAAYYCSQCNFGMTKLCGAARQLEFSDIIVALEHVPRLQSEFQTPAVLSEALPQCIRNKLQFRQVENARRVLLICQAVINKCLGRSTLSQAILDQFRPRVEMGLAQFGANINSVLLEEHTDALSPKGILGKREHLAVPEQAVLLQVAGRLTCTSVGYWSFRDIREIFDESMLTALKNAVRALMEHARECESCSKAQEDLCICGKFVNLFTDGVYSCPQCGTLQHLRCAKKGSCHGCSIQ